MDVPFYIKVSGRVFGKQPYRTRESSFGTTVSFNLDVGEHQFQLGDQVVKQKLTIFPQFKLGKPGVPEVLQTGAQLRVVGESFAKVGQNDYSVVEGRRVDDLSKIDWKWASLTPNLDLLAITTTPVPYNEIRGALAVEKVGHKPNLSGTFVLFYREYQNQKATDNHLKYRKAYVRAYAPPSIAIPGPSADNRHPTYVFVSGRMMRNPLDKEDNSPMIYIDAIDR